MTGYGRGEVKVGDKEFLVEIKSINHRYIDYFIKIPRKISFLEDKVRKYVGDFISRGKLDIFVTYENLNDESKSVLLDEPLSKAYVAAIKSLRDNFGLNDDISTSLIASFPDILKVQKNAENVDELWHVLEIALDQCLKSLVKMRMSEGEKLKISVIEKLDLIESQLDLINCYSGKVVLDYKERLEARLEELLGQQTLDENRLAIEVVLFADRCSIDEEIVRFKSHINQFRETLEIKQPVGRKLDFILQEMNREINTIGSKANNLEITKSVVEIKSEVEKIREQVQNIE